MVTTPYLHDLAVCGAYLKMSIVQRNTTAIRQFSPQLRDLVLRAWEDGHETIAANYHSVLQEAELTLNGNPAGKDCSADFIVHKKTA